MSEIVHLIFFSVVLMICLFIIKKSNVTHKRRWHLVSLIIAFILFILSGFVPIENAFITFSSPESAFRYTNSGDEMLVVEGEESAWVLGDEVSDIIPKSGTGWKLSLVGDLKTIITNISLNGIGFWVYQYKDSEDYYIMVSDPKGGAADVTDNRNSEFYYLTDDSNTLDLTYYTYYAYVNNIDDEYTLIVNGEVIPVVDEQN